MATKAKTHVNAAPATHSSTLPKEMEEALVQALNLMDVGKLKEAATALEELHVKALEAGLPALVHGVRARMEGLRQRELKEHESVLPSLKAQVLLTRGEDEAALALLDKAVITDPGRASLHYLRAMVLVRADKLADSAIALAKAFELEPELRYTYFLEPEFEDVRETAPFALFEMA